MAEEQESPCDVEDLLCRMAALGHLKGLKSVLGEEKYRTEFPELQSLDDKIVSREADLREALGRCGRIASGEPKESKTEEDE